MGMAIQMPAAVVGPIPNPHGVMTENNQLLVSRFWYGDFDRDQRGENYNWAIRS